MPPDADDPLDDRAIAPDTQGDDAQFDRSLRPKTFEEYVGQASIVDNLKVYVAAARRRNEPLDHVLFTGPLRDRFGIVNRLEYYSPAELAQIVRRSAQILTITLDPSGAEEIAHRSRGTPRIANRLLRRIRDFAEIEGNGIITRAIADRA